MCTYDPNMANLRYDLNLTKLCLGEEEARKLVLEWVSRNTFCENIYEIFFQVTQF